MKTLIFLSIFLLFGALNVHAQNSGREVYPEQISIDHNQAVKNFSGDYVSVLPLTSSDLIDTPVSIGHVANISIIGIENMVNVHQAGLGNTAGIKVDGNFNDIDLRQDGMGNRSAINLIGSQNTIEGFQQGSYNNLNVNYSGSGLNQRFHQLGNHQTIEMSGIGTPISITQTGDGATIFIENR